MVNWYTTGRGELLQPKDSALFSFITNSQVLHLPFKSMFRPTADFLA